MGFSIGDVLPTSHMGLPTMPELTGQEAAKKAKRDINDASNKSIDFRREMWQTSRSDLAPYRQAGTNALSRMQDFQMPSFTWGDFQADPGYQFRLNQGLDAVDKRAGAGLMRNSGRTLKELMNYGQGMASNEYGNWYNRRERDYARAMGEGQDQWNRLATMAGFGGNANSQAVNANANTAAGISQQYGNIGAANAAADMQGYNGLMNLINAGARIGGMLA